MMPTRPIAARLALKLLFARPFQTVHLSLRSLPLAILLAELLSIAGDWPVEAGVSLFVAGRFAFRLASLFCVGVVLAGIFPRLTRARDLLVLWVWMLVAVCALRAAATWGITRFPATSEWSNAHFPMLPEVLMALPAAWAGIALLRYISLIATSKRTIMAAFALFLIETAHGWLAWQQPYWTMSSGSVQSTAAFSESQLYNQNVLLDAQLDVVAPRIAGERNVYVIAIAGNGDEQVFLNEARLAHTTLSRHFHARDAVLLANHPAHATMLPLVTRTSLTRAIRSVSQRMKLDEDILVLYITSHGSPDFDLQLIQPPVEFDPITPQWMKGTLDDAGIHYRAIFISGCFSGGYIDALANQNTLIMTASDATHPSFGCGHESDLTWFGNALLVHALPQARTIPEAWPIATQIIKKWESEQQIEASNPQLRIGQHFATHLGWVSGQASTTAVMPE
ncbi:C13 family peptidase [Burkholderiaceae bacterium DAT-1]|nr:C13 family peptidase [Burkholderiaceae bacterium DAT-1]